jgi:hypothetical protein
MTTIDSDQTSGVRFTEDQRRALDEEGYVVVPDLLEDGECDLWSRVLDDAWLEDQRTLPPHPAGEEPGVQFVRNPLRHSLVFEKCVIDPLILEAARSMIGPALVLHIMNARRVDPGYGEQPLHDLTRRRGRPFRVCNTIWCLDEFTPDNGSTRVIHGSHLADQEFLARMTDPMAPHPDERMVVAPRGAVLLFNSALIHSGTRNRTGRPRRSIQCNFAVDTMDPFYPWHEQLAPHLQAALTPKGRQLLGLVTGRGRDAGPAD